MRDRLIFYSGAVIDGLQPRYDRTGWRIDRQFGIWHRPQVLFISDSMDEDWYWALALIMLPVVIFAGIEGYHRFIRRRSVKIATRRKA